MSGLIDQILSAGGGQAVEMIAGRFGISPAQSQSAIEALAPMIAGGFKNQANSGGLENILGSVLNQNHVQIGDNPEELARPGTTAAGNEILGAIFGSKDVSRQVATNAANQTGLSTDLLKQMLPVLATMAAGAMASKANSGGLGSILGNAIGNSAGGGIGDILNSVTQGNTGGNAGILGNLANMIDMDKDGNPLDDIMKMIGR
ncbi:DUF937 domain-containing protein [Pseudaquidulcibacter saccharophilus]|uniref:DUF937 domain-containing protein n=1 Tax=Pseudaquidulcibacter saccharophilus TaxID=2831900 RepID=UPI001EFF1E45|nr:DUF937 domain-containing protein [Pseudaquidulcibacter saccharophilus]